MMIMALTDMTNTMTIVVTTSDHEQGSPAAHGKTFKEVKKWISLIA